MANDDATPSANNAPVPLLTGLAPSSSVGIPGGGCRNHPDPLCGCDEWQPFHGMVHRNSSVGIAGITDGTSTADLLATAPRAAHP